MKKRIELKEAFWGPSAEKMRSRLYAPLQRLELQNFNRYNKVSWGVYNVLRGYFTINAENTHYTAAQAVFRYFGRR